MRILEVGFGTSGVNIEKGYYPQGVTVIGLDPMLATYPPVTPRITDYSTTATTVSAGTTATTVADVGAATNVATATTTATTTTTTMAAAERLYQQQAAVALTKGVHLAGLVQGKAEELPFADASFDAVGELLTH